MSELLYDKGGPLRPGLTRVLNEAMRPIPLMPWQIATLEAWCGTEAGRRALNFVLNATKKPIIHNGGKP